MEQQPLKSAEDKLAAILSELRSLNRRDRLRMLGGFFRGLLTLIPTILFLYGLWYFSANQESVMKYIMEHAATSASDFATKTNDSIMKEFQKARR